MDESHNHNVMAGFFHLNEHLLYPPTRGNTIYALVSQARGLLSGRGRGGGVSKRSGRKDDRELLG